MRGANPTDRGKKGRKRSLLVDGRGVPLSLVGSGANVHDVKLLAATLDGVVSARPTPRGRRPQHLCADAGNKGALAKKSAQARGYQPLIQQRRGEAEAKKNQPGYRARRWVVERTHSWLNRYRKLLVSFEKTEEGYVALLTLAAAMICWRQTIVIYGYALSSAVKRILSGHQDDRVAATGQGKGLCEAAGGGGTGTGAGLRG